MLAEIDRAEAKVLEGSYGVCDTCGAPIAPARLEARFWSTHCVTAPDANEPVGASMEPTGLFRRTAGAWRTTVPFGLAAGTLYFIIIGALTIFTSVLGGEPTVRCSGWSSSSA